MANKIECVITLKMPDGKWIKNSEFWGVVDTLPRIGDHFCINSDRVGRFGNAFAWMELLPYIPDGEDKDYIKYLCDEGKHPCDTYTIEELDRVADIFEKHLELWKYCKVHDIVHTNNINIDGDFFDLDTFIVLEEDKEWYENYYHYCCYGRDCK